MIQATQKDLISGMTSGLGAMLVTGQLAKTPRLIFGLTKEQKQASFKLSYTCATVDALKREELARNGGNKSSRLYVKLTNLEEHLGLVLDEYRIQKFHKTDLDKAAKAFDFLDQKIGEMYK